MARAVPAPKTDYPASAWEEGIKKAEAIDWNEQYARLCFFTGVFEQLHYLQSITKNRRYCFIILSMNFITHLTRRKEKIIELRE